MLQIVSSNNVAALKRSNWWKQIDALAGDPQGQLAKRASQAAAMLNAAWWAGDEATSELYTELCERFVSQGLMDKRHVAPGFRDPPPTLVQLQQLGVHAFEEDYTSSMRRFIPPEEAKRLPPDERVEVKSQDVLDRYGNMRCLQLGGFGTYPKALLTYAPRLGISLTQFVVICTISNAQPGKRIEQAWIAQRSLCSIATAKRAISELIKAGYLVVKRGSKWDGCLYDLGPLWAAMDRLYQDDIG